MNNLVWNVPEVLWALWLVPFFIFLAVYAYVKKRKAYLAFNGSRMKSGLPLILKYGLIILSFVMLVFSLARPAMDIRTVEKETIGRDTLFIFDVSNSMMAEDLKPNRLQQAVLSIVDGLDALKGNRLGIMAFAGTSLVLCPLTHDYSFFMDTLKTIGPDSVSRGGTMTGDAFRKTEKEIIENKSDKSLEIVLVTDGEDQESFPVEAAASLNKYEINILAIMTGNDSTGARIPVYDDQGRKSFIMHDGREVWSVARTDILRQIVDSLPGSALVQVKEGSLNFASVYRAFAENSENKKTITSSIEQLELFQLFLLFSVIFLITSFIFTVNWRGA